MSVTTVDKDTKALTMTIVSEFDAPVERVWELWADPRQLERWWGPPTYPATFEEHDLRPGAHVKYFMTGPDGDKARGWWKVVAVDAPHHLELEDGFGDASGDPDPELPVMMMRVSLEALAADKTGTTRMTIQTTFPSADAMEQVISMGMDEGMAAAIGQIDDLLAA